MQAFCIKLSVAPIEGAIFHNVHVIDVSKCDCTGSRMKEKDHTTGNYNTQQSLLTTLNTPVQNAINIIFTLPQES